MKDCNGFVNEAVAAYVELISSNDYDEIEYEKLNGMPFYETLVRRLASTHPQFADPPGIEREYPHPLIRKMINSVDGYLQGHEIIRTRAYLPNGEIPNNFKISRGLKFTIKVDGIVEGFFQNGESEVLTAKIKRHFEQLSLKTR